MRTLSPGAARKVEVGMGARGGDTEEADDDDCAVVLFRTVYCSFQNCLLFFSELFLVLFRNQLSADRRRQEEEEGLFKGGG